MGSDLSMSPPTQSVYRVVWGREYLALYSRKTDTIHPREETENWYLVYCTNDPDQDILSTVCIVFDLIARGRYMQLERNDLVLPESDEPFPVKLPREELERDNSPLEKKAMRLRKELAELESRIANGETEE